MLEDELLPAYDVADAVAVVVHANAGTTWAALMDVDLIELGRRHPLVGLLGAVRLLPELIGHLLQGEPPPAAPKMHAPPRDHHDTGKQRRLDPVRREARRGDRARWSASSGSQ